MGMSLGSCVAIFPLNVCCVCSAEKSLGTSTFDREKKIPIFIKAVNCPVQIQGSIIW